MLEELDAVLSLACEEVLLRLRQIRRRKPVYLGGSMCGSADVAECLDAMYLGGRRSRVFCVKVGSKECVMAFFGTAEIPF